MIRRNNNSYTLLILLFELLGIAFAKFVKFSVLQAITPRVIYEPYNYEGINVSKTRLS